MRPASGPSDLAFLPSRAGGDWPPAHETQHGHGPAEFSCTDCTAFAHSTAKIRISSDASPEPQLAVDPRPDRRRPLDSEAGSSCTKPSRSHGTWLTTGTEWMDLPKEIPLPGRKSKLAGSLMQDARNFCLMALVLRAGGGRFGGAHSWIGMALCVPNEIAFKNM